MSWRRPASPVDSSLNDEVPRVRLPVDVAIDDPRVEALAGTFADRFRPFCAGMPAEAFARLARHAAWIRLRWP